jgi:hypothetical protein
MQTSEGVLGRINPRAIFEARGVGECDIVKGRLKKGAKFAAKRGRKEVGGLD